MKAGASAKATETIPSSRRWHSQCGPPKECCRTRSTEAPCPPQRPQTHCRVEADSWPSIPRPKSGCLSHPLLWDFSSAPKLRRIFCPQSHKQLFFFLVVAGLPVGSNGTSHQCTRAAGGPLTSLDEDLRVIISKLTSFCAVNGSTQLCKDGTCHDKWSRVLSASRVSQVRSCSVAEAWRVRVAKVICLHLVVTPRPQAARTHTSLFPP